jgi:outer membrane protein assembly factor BamB
MKMLKNKTAAIAIAVLLMLLMTASMTLTPNAIAHTPAWQIPTYSFIAVEPSIIGVGQKLSVVFWLDSAPPTASTEYGDRWNNMTVKVTHPDGTTETLGPFTSDDTGGIFTSYTPSIVGNYTFQMFFGGQTLAGDNPAPGAPHPSIGDYFEPSESRISRVTVQEEPIETLPSNPLPAEYWTHPINAENKDWFSLSGNWLWSHNANGDLNMITSAPESSHIAWNKELTFGGIVGGEAGAGQSYYGGMAYESKFAPPVIIGGKLYYNLFGVMSPLPGFVCVDLTTGEEIWRNNDDRIGLGQILEYDSPNQHGSLAYLWSTYTSTWRMYDAFTGTLMMNLTGAQTTITDGSRNFVYGPNGELLVYLLNSAGRWLAMWNSTQCIIAGTNGAAAWQWRPYIKTINWNLGIQWNETIPGTDVIPANVAMKYVAEDVVLTESYINPGAGETSPTFVHAAFSGSTGAMLWRQTRKDIGYGPGGYNAPGLLWEPIDGREGVYVGFRKETTQWYAYSLLTGDYLWKTESLESLSNSWSFFDWYGQIAYGKLYIFGYSGTIDAFDLSTGHHLWEFSAPNSGLETPYGTYPFYRCITVADGKIYAANNEHSPNTPYWRDFKLYCINATTGEEIWDIPGWFAQRPTMPVTDGYLLGYNNYDNQLYCFGKGPTATTVTAPDTELTFGSSFVIHGTVTDASAGAKQTEMVARFPNGVPAVSEESMSGWMAYLYMQHPCPASVTGVPVSIDVLDSNGNYRNIGTATSDGSGTFAYTWTPDIPGDFTVIATFAGSESYWPSNAEAHFTAAMPAPTAAPTAAPQSNLATTTDLLMYIAIAAIAIIIAIAIVGVLILRKHP